MKNTYLFIFVLFFAACKDLKDYPLPQDDINGNQGAAGVYILCEGLFAQNSASFAYYAFEEKRFTRDIFSERNGRKLGDTANDMQQYGGKIYIVVDNSGTVEVLDVRTGKSVKQIPIRNASNKNRHPRCIAFHEGKAFVACFDSTVCQIDTTTFEIEKTTQAGAYPDGICIADNNIYISNSGERNGTKAGNTVSIIDIPSFRKTREITVADNPFKMAADSEGDVYLASRGSYRGDGPYMLQKIDKQMNITSFPNIEALNFCIVRDTAYIYCYNFVTQQNTVLTFDCRREEVIDGNFIKGDMLQTPYGIAVNAQNGDVYIADAGSFTATGDVYCFDKKGAYKFKISDVGINPNAMIFAYTENSGGENNKTINHIAEVIDYHPAPGQFIGEGDMSVDALRYAREVLLHKGGLVSLGGWGGYITLGFNEPLQRFRIYGNAYYYANYENIGGSCEPGIVLVSENGAEWYELRGSEYNNPQTIHDYEITYYRPNPIDGDVRWTDNKGGVGYVYRNTYHSQPSYYPLWTNAETLTFKGCRLPNNGEQLSGAYLLHAFAYGYADNQPNAESVFDVADAVDNAGNAVSLNNVRYLRIYSAINLYNAVIGEVSTEIGGVEIIE
ncbi:surface protein [Bacteroidia bacterium]|nr:surface protein [Bacteroidia bacterium]